VGRTLNDGVVIVGMVADVQISPCFGHSSPLSGEETAYIPAAQVNGRLLTLVHTWFQPSWIVRTAAPVEGLTAQMQRALSSADPSLPFSGFYAMSELRAETLATQRIEVALLSAMAALALLLSAVGIFALVANIVAQRTREIGIRIALGSSVRQAMAHVAGSGLRASALGLVLGLLLCVAAGAAQCALRCRRLRCIHPRGRDLHAGSGHPAGHHCPGPEDCADRPGDDLAG
jgi:predicted lysophospholipase L1 biosynthesis ABC-type transport system permease subunit